MDDFYNLDEDKSYFEYFKDFINLKDDEDIIVKILQSNAKEHQSS